MLRAYETKVRDENTVLGFDGLNPNLRKAHGKMMVANEYDKNFWCRLHQRGLRGQLREKWKHEVEGTVER